MHNGFVFSYSLINGISDHLIPRNQGDEVRESRERCQAQLRELTRAQERPDVQSHATSPPYRKTDRRSIHNIINPQTLVQPTGDETVMAFSVT